MEQLSNQPWIRHWAEEDRRRYNSWVARRRDFALPGYQSFADVGLDHEWTTPYHLASCSPDGPVLLTYNYLDAPSALTYRALLLQHGFLAQMPFNRVLDLALKSAGLSRSDLYVTHAFHLLPASRSATIRTADLDQSFDAIGRYEIDQRQVVALGDAAARLCRRHGIKHTSAPHPSARGASFDAKANLLAAALTSRCA